MLTVSVIALLDVETAVPAAARLKEFTLRHHRDLESSDSRLIPDWRDMRETPARSTVQRIIFTITVLSVLAAMFLNPIALWELLVAFLKLPFRVFQLVYTLCRTKSEPRVPTAPAVPTAPVAPITPAVQPKRTHPVHFRDPVSHGTDVFCFFDTWLHDSLHVGMLMQLLKSPDPKSVSRKHFEEICIWLLNYASWRSEVARLSSMSESLERQAIERSNFNTLRELIGLRKAARRTKDGIKDFERNHKPTEALTRIETTGLWAIQQDNLNSGKSPMHQEIRVNNNKDDVRSGSACELDMSDGQKDLILALQHVDDSIKRSLDLLHAAIAVKASDRALWLALIVTFYFPATLATGIFGMNLSLIADKPWWWAIVLWAILSIPTLFFSVYVFVWR